MTRKRSGGGITRDQEHRRVASAVPAPLIAHPNADHARLYANFLGALPGDQRDHPAARALASTAATLATQIHRIAAALEAIGDVSPTALDDPRNRELVRLTRALIAALRAMRVLPSGDKRVMASGAALERAQRGGIDLEPPPANGAPAIDWVKLWEKERRRQ